MDPKLKMVHKTQIMTLIKRNTKITKILLQILETATISLNPILAQVLQTPLPKI